MQHAVTSLSGTRFVPPLTHRTQSGAMLHSGHCLSIRKWRESVIPDRCFAALSMTECTVTVYLYIYIVTVMFVTQYQHLSSKP